MLETGSKGSEFESKATEDLVGKSSKLIADPTSQENIKRLINFDLERQQAVEDYNLGLEYAPEDVRFKHKTFVGNSVIVKLEKFDWLIPSTINSELFAINQLHYLTVTTPDFPQGKFIQNPLPYNYRGVVVAVGDEVVKYRAENNLLPLEPGDIVELTWFDLKEMRYYADKNKVDRITLDTPYAPNFEGFAKVPAQFIEAIIKESEFELVYGKSREEMYKKSITEANMDMSEFEHMAQLQAEESQDTTGMAGLVIPENN